MSSKPRRRFLPPNANAVAVRNPLQVVRNVGVPPRGIVARVGAVIPRIFVNRVVPLAARANPYVGAAVAIGYGIKAVYDGVNWVVSSVNQAHGAVQDARRMYDHAANFASDAYDYLTGPREAGIIDPPFTADESGRSMLSDSIQDPPVFDRNVTSSRPVLGVPPSVATQSDLGFAKMIYDPTAFRKVRRFRKRRRFARFLFRR